jgi:hypothetical protein
MTKRKKFMKFISGNPALFQLAADLQASHPPAPPLSPGKNIIIL